MTHGDRAFAGSCRHTSNAPATDVAQRRHGPRGVAPTSHRWRATSPRVCLAMWLAPGTRTCTQRAARSAPGRHAAAYDADRQSTTTPRAGDLGQHLVQRRSPQRGQRAEPGQRRAHRQPVGGDPVARAHGAVQRRDDDEPAVGAAAGRGVERGQPERVVEHAGVDLGGRGGRRRVEHEVAGHLVEQAGGDAEQGRCLGGAADVGEGGGDPGAGGSRARGTTTSTGPRACPGAGSTLDSDGGSRISTGAAYGG